ncbi:MAG: heme A synthase [Pseudomonadota bacterium]
MSDKRSVFAEVGEGQIPATPKKQGLIDGGRGGKPKAVRVWLWMLFGLVISMIAVGGLTRLTDSGLSITEWAPVTGAIPPLSPEDWQSEFDKYKQIPEYQLQNAGMTLAEFKVIYWWEWGHRQLGRVIGLVWFVGFVGLLVTKAVPKGWFPRLLLLGALGGVQGAIGWWMVSSGLTGTMLDVASYRLATHLGLAFVILGLIYWYICLLGRERAELFQAQRTRNSTMVTWSNGLLALAFVQILLGALVAGLDAGRTYTDWPLMAGQVFPATGWDLSPGWRNFFENAGLAQFNHRITGYLLGILAVVAFLRSRKVSNASIKSAFTAMHGLVWVQIIWGIATVLYAAPWQLAIVHQLLAVAIICLLLRAKFFSTYPLPERIS